MVTREPCSSSARLVGKLDIDDLQHERSYSAMRAYGDAKLADILFARGLNARYGEEGIRAVAFDPGNVRTNFASETNNPVARLMYRTPLSRLVLISPEKGGKNLAFFVEGTPGHDWEPDRFYTHTSPAKPRQTNRQVDDDALVAALWRRCEALTGLAAAHG
jgi:NAD(P)-dependent dehydrogenase (short-subunit alcohol dehydrogenase family)